MKTLIGGMIGTQPDYAVVIVSAENGITAGTEEHFRIAFTLKVPVIVVVTKIDLVDEETRQDMIHDIQILL
jgi:elongation factor 1-alpha